jgi:hypothetical protein
MGTYGRTNCTVSLPAMHKQREGTQKKKKKKKKKVLALLVC